MEYQTNFLSKMSFLKPRKRQHCALLPTPTFTCRSVAGSPAAQLLPSGPWASASEEPGLLSHAWGIQALAFLSVNLVNEGELGDKPPPRMVFLASWCCSLPGQRQQKECVGAEQDISPPLLGIPKEAQCPFSCEEPWMEPPLEEKRWGLRVPERLRRFHTTLSQPWAFSCRHLAAQRAG